METTIVLGYNGIMEKKMETTIVLFGTEAFSATDRKRCVVCFTALPRGQIPDLPDPHVSLGFRGLGFRV